MKLSFGTIKVKIKDFSRSLSEPTVFHYLLLKFNFFFKIPQKPPALHRACRIWERRNKCFVMCRIEMSRCYKPNPWSDGLQLYSSPASCELCKKSINIEIFKSWSTGARLGCSKLVVHIFCYSLSKWTIAKSRTRKGLANSLSPQSQIKYYFKM